jgi:predicted dehydrogenase
MRSIRFGVVGLGFGLHVHVPALRRLSGCEVVALCGRDAVRTRVKGEASGIHHVFDDWRVMVQQDALDAITIAVPPSAQPEIAMAAIRCGKAVFCEKPLGVCVADVEALVTAAARVPNMIDFEFAAVPAFVRTKVLLDQGAIGTVHHVTVNWQVETYSHRQATRSWKHDVEFGGGTLNGFGSHVLHYLEWLFGPITRIQCALSDRAGGADNEVRLWTEFSAGGVAAVSMASNSFLGSGHRIEIYGSDGAITLANPERDYVRGFQVRWARRPAERFTEEASVAGNERGDGRVAAVAVLLRRFTDWIVSGTPNAPTLDAGRRVQHLLGLARQSNLTGRWVGCGEPVAEPIR